MIQPREEIPGEFGHPRWKMNTFAGLILCVIGVALMITVAFFVYGAAVFAAGAAWAVIACIIGARQEHHDFHHHTPA